MPKKECGNLVIFLKMNIIHQREYTKKKLVGFSDKETKHFMLLFRHISYFATQCYFVTYHLGIHKGYSAGYCKLGFQTVSSQAGGTVRLCFSGNDGLLYETV